MNPALNRRQFLHSTAMKLGAVFLPVSGVFAGEAFRRPGPARLQLGLAAYSFRDYFHDSSHDWKAQTDPAKRIDLFQFVDYCASHGVAGAELTSYYFPPDVDEAFLIRLRRHCFLRGVDVSGTSVGNNFTLPKGEKRDTEIRGVKKWVDYAAVLGAPHIRVFAGTAPKGVTQEEAVKNCLATLVECADYAGRRGIFLGIENHGGIVADPKVLLEIVRTVKSQWVGINLDSANFHTDDPYADFALCAPYTVNVQMKSEIQRRAGEKEAADLPRFTKILRDSNYQGYVTLEYEAELDPWIGVPPLLKQMQALFQG